MPQREVVRFIVNAALFVAILLLLDKGVVANGLPWIMEQFSAHVEHDQMRAELQVRYAPGNDVVFLGSSCVAGGIDVGTIQHAWLVSQLPYLPLNCGMLGLRTQEMPMIEQFVLRRGVVAAVYLYDYGSVFAPEDVAASSTRWDVREWLRAYSIREKLLDLPQFLPGFLGQLLFTVRYRHVIWTFSGDLADLGGAEQPVKMQDVPPAVMPWIPQAPGGQGRRLATMWELMAHVLSKGQPPPESLAARGLRRFLRSARARGVRVILMPFPEIISNDKAAAVDRVVGGIAAQEGATLLPRAEVEVFAANPQLYLEESPVHLNEIGARQFSRWLARRLTLLLKP